jgi:hypothetical protein
MSISPDHSSSLIAISTPVHTDIDASIRQLHNYSRFFGGNIVYLMHLSREASHLRDDYNKAISSFPNAILLPESRATSIYCTLGAHIAATEYLLNEYMRPDFIYFHSASDLLIKRGLARHIEITKSGIMHYRIDESNWMWSEHLKADKSFSAFLDELSICTQDIYFGRIEGSYMKFEFWLEAYAVIKRVYDLDSFISGNAGVWPVEESLIPTYYLNTQGIPNSNIAVETKRLNGMESRNSPISLIELEAYLLNPAVFGAKWFASDLRDPALLYLKNLEGQGDKKL